MNFEKSKRRPGMRHWGMLAATAPEQLRRAVAAHCKSTAFALALLCVAGLFVFPGCGGKEESHLHPPGTHGGFIVALGRDHYHAEVLFAEGELRLFILGKDEIEIVEIESQRIEVYLRPFGDARSRTVTLEPISQVGDADGRCSMFSGLLPEDLPALQIQVTVPMINVDGKRYRFSFATSEPLMPGKVSKDAERELYLTPGGLYTQTDIEANGAQTASEKFAGFVSQHNMDPAVGTLVCPITSTAANPKCTWIIGGAEYQFCCPPCVDEFLRRSKEDPDSILKPREYVKK